MKYAVLANSPIKVPAHVRAYLQRKAAQRRKPGTSAYKAEKARQRRLRALAR